MNELIRQLAVQAGAELHGSAGFTNIIVNQRDADDLMIKFAELIVRECARFLDENSGADECGNVRHPEPEELLKHFGVDE